MATRAPRSRRSSSGPAHDPRWGDIHAFPGATNAASNALCRKSGFEELGSLTVDYAGRMLRVNHWVWRVPVDRAPFG